VRPEESAAADVPELEPELALVPAPAASPELDMDAALAPGSVASLGRESDALPESALPANGNGIKTIHLVDTIFEYML